MSSTTSGARESAPPQFYIIAGPNGVGKTTFAMSFLPDAAGCRDFLNADEIARGLSPLDPEAAALTAGRILLEQVHRRIEERRSFALETTLSGRVYVKYVRAAREAGFEVNMVFLWVPSVQITIDRIRERVNHGGHDIPDAVSRRRFAATMRNLFQVYWEHLDFVAILDCSVAPPREIYERDDSVETVFYPKTYKTIRRMAGECDS